MSATHYFMESEHHNFIPESPEDTRFRETERRQRAVMRNILEGMPHVQTVPGSDDVYVDGQQIFFNHIQGLERVKAEDVHEVTDVANPLLPTLARYIKSLTVDQRFELARRAKAEFRSYYEWHENAYAKEEDNT